MTISTTIIKNSYSGTGSQDVFPYTFKITADADIQVIIRAATGTETVKNLTTHYTVSGAGDASGGNVTFTSGNIPTATETVVLRRNTTQTQGVDLVENDPFTAESVEGAFDKNLSIAQELQEQVNRSIKLSRTNTMTSTEFTVGATDRANKILAFDSSGEISVTQELGTFVGNWSASTTYNARDIVKDTSTNNIFICTTTHTSSGSQPLTTNTDSGKWSLLVDAASATTSQNAASSSATAAANSATAAATSATNAANSATAAATSETNAGNSATSASTSASNASTSETNAASSATAAATSATNAGTSETNAGTSATNAATSATNAATSASNASTSETNAAASATTATTQASAASTSASNAATSATNASTAQTAAETAKTAAETAQAAAETALDTFDDRFLGSKSSDPTVDNDGNTLVDGALYFDTTNNLMKVYDLGNTTWHQLALTGTNQTNVNLVAGQISPTNNISSVAGKATEIGLLGVADVITDMGLLGTSANVTAMGHLGTSANVTAMGTLGTSSNVTNMATCAGAVTNINNVGGSIANVNTTATNIAGVNSFAERYRVASSDPTSSLDAGDLAFNTTGNQLKYYDGSSWNTVAAQDTQVKISGNDSSADVLINKLTAGNLITLTETNDGSNETITVASTAASTGKAIAMAIVFG